MLVAAHPEISHPAIKKLTIVFMVAPFFMVAPCCLRAERAQSTFSVAWRRVENQGPRAQTSVGPVLHL
jgi:hypothetical protein